MAAIEEVYRCDEPGCDWTHDGRYRPAQEENNRIDAHAMGHGKRCRPFEPNMGKLIHVSRPFALDQWGEWWVWRTNRWQWAPFGKEEHGS
jgi:hypothetical protein